jgi:hypothetical protein
VVLTDRATQCLTSFSLDFERRSTANRAAGPRMKVSAVLVNGRPAVFGFAQPAYPDDPNGPNDPNPAAHEASQLSHVGGPAHNPLPPACSPELKTTSFAKRNSQNGQQCPANKLVITPAAPVRDGAAFTVAVFYTGRPGVHILEVIHGELTFPYRNMQQNPEPDRPRWAIPFRITEGAPVLPPPPETQAQTVVRRLPPQGELVATPQFSAILEPVTVTGAGFEPGKSYKLNWTRVIGNRMTGRGWEVSATPVAEATADAQGNATFQFKVPDDLGGEHGLFVDMGGGKKKEGTFWIKATAAPLKVGRGPVGTEFRIHLKGVGWSETANIVHLVYDNSYIGYACAFNSQGDVELIMIATGEPGWHFIDLYPGIYKGQETRPNNFRIPQLTYADDHPGEDLPAFRYAFEVTPGGGTVGASNAVR